MINLVNTLQSMAKGAAVGVMAITALPVYGAVGTITAAGICVGSLLGAAAALIDEIEDKK